MFAKTTNGQRDIFRRRAHGQGHIERDIEQQVPDTNAKLVCIAGGGSVRAGSGKPAEDGHNNVESMTAGEGLCWNGFADLARLGIHFRTTCVRQIRWQSCGGLRCPGTRCVREATTSDEKD